MLISQGEYNEYKDFAFTACKFTLESPVTGARKHFYFDCDEQKNFTEIRYDGVAEILP